MVFKTNYHLMQVKIIAEYSKSTIRSTFIKLPFFMETFVLSIFEWPLYTGFTVHVSQQKSSVLDARIRTCTRT